MLGKKFLTGAFILLGCSLSFNPNLINIPQAHAAEYVQTKNYHNLEKIVQKEPRIKKYLPMIKESVKKYEDIYSVNPLLVIALLKAETGHFDKNAVSWAGAAGLAQIIPETAVAYGLKAYNPEYLHESRQDRRMALQYKRKFTDEISKKNGKSIDRIIEYKKKYRSYKEKSAAGFVKYKNDLLDMLKGKSVEELKEIDERFIPAVAIDFCVKHLAELLESRGGNMREAVSAYNAGIGAVIRYNGIPPYNETVKYQNKTINYYRDYERFMEIKN